MVCCAGLGCESSLIEAAKRQDDVQGYRRFLSRHPNSVHGSALRRSLERAFFRQAREADRPLAYREYLAAYPRGRYRPEARRRLAQLSLAGAKSEADYRLVLEHHGDDAVAPVALARLGDLMAERLLRDRDAGAAQSFLDQFADHPRRPAVNEHLARIVWVDLRGSIAELERFVQRFRETRFGSRAESALRRKMMEAVERTGDVELFEEFAARFPQEPNLPTLRQWVVLLQIESALRSLRFDRIDAIVSQGGATRLDTSAEVTRRLEQARRVQRTCRRQPVRCERLRQLARQAGPYRPTGSLVALRAQVFGPDPLRGALAITTIGSVDDTAAGKLLMELVGSARLPAVYQGVPALKDWLERRLPDSRARFAAGLLGKAHRSNRDEVQREAVLRILLGQVDLGRRRLRTLLGRNDGEAVALYLLVRHGNDPDRQLQRALLRHLSKRVDALVAGFPGELGPDSRLVALIAAHELEVIGEVAAEVFPDGAGQALGRRVRGIADGWRGRMVILGLRSAKEQLPSGLQQAMAAHGAGRLPALATLLASSDPVSRLLAFVHCRERQRLKLRTLARCAVRIERGP
jgi:hypothetical protein